jgi:transcriptional regulator with XRE-family HTH domain
MGCRRPSEFVVLLHLGEWRVHFALTQQQLADRAGLNVRTIMSAEQGKQVRLTTVQRLATALGLGNRPWLLYKPPPQ